MEQDLNCRNNNYDEGERRGVGVGPKGIFITKNTYSDGLDVTWTGRVSLFFLFFERGFQDAVFSSVTVLLAFPVVRWPGTADLIYQWIYGCITYTKTNLVA